MKFHIRSDLIIELNWRENEILSPYLSLFDCLKTSKHADLYTPLSPKVSWFIQGNGEVWKQKDEDGSFPSFITVVRQDYFK